MKLAVAGIPGAWSSERMAQALAELGHEAFVFPTSALMHDLATGAVTAGEADLGTVDAVVVKKLGAQADAALRLRLHALRALEARGIRAFNRADVIDVAMDRYRMTMVLAAAGLPLPRTIAVHSAEALPGAVAALGDCVVKPVYTSKGRGMLRVQSAADLGALDADAASCWIAQQFVDAPGRDIGATVIGGKFAGAFYRVARAGEWMTTTDAGGRYEPCELSPVGIGYAERAAQAFGLDYTVVDLVEQAGDFLLYEVSAFGGFRGLREACGVDAASLYAAHVARELAAGR
jgi:ribosomal protein S6--L-glutamate ligase